MNVWISTRRVAVAAMLAAAALAVVPAATIAQGPTPAAPAAQPADTAAPATATPAPAPNIANGPAGKQMEIVDNPYGLEAMWRGGDIVLKITLGILVFMSIGSWYVIITKFYEQTKVRGQA